MCYKACGYSHSNTDNVRFIASVWSVHFPRMMLMCTVQVFTIKRINTLRPRQKGRHFANDIFICILLNENVWILIRISLKFVPKCLINNNPALVQIMAWRRPGDKPLSKPMMVSLPMHICVIRPQWVKETVMVGTVLTFNWNFICKERTLISILFHSWHNTLTDTRVRERTNAHQRTFPHHWCHFDDIHAPNLLQVWVLCVC